MATIVFNHKSPLGTTCRNAPLCKENFKKALPNNRLIVQFRAFLWFRDIIIYMTNLAVDQMQEEGLVRSLHGGLAQVESIQTEACAHCGAKGACHALGGEKTRVVTALNDAGAQVGDKVLLNMPRRAVLGASFLAYMVPVLGLLLGAVLGNSLAPSWGWDAQTGAVLLGLGGLAVSWFWVTVIAKKLAKGSNFTVRIVRVLEKGATDALDECATGL